ncbi:MAG: hypothetical protein COB02_12775 [Candidatus Cloacimonadota bacterium]|nr:MAG: hypothetical protein COB02_12775 [Candidatus Cloacimonadota bacterium]
MGIFSIGEVDILSDKYFSELSNRMKNFVLQTIDSIKSSQTYIKDGTLDSEQPFTFWKNKYLKVITLEERSLAQRMMILKVLELETSEKLYFNQWAQILDESRKLNSSEISDEEAFCLNKLYRAIRSFEDSKYLISFIPKESSYYETVFTKLLTYRNKSTQWITLILYSLSVETDQSIKVELELKRYKGQTFCNLWDEIKRNLKNTRSLLINPSTSSQDMEALHYRVARMKLLKSFLIENLVQYELIELLDFTPKVAMDNELEDKIVEQVRQVVYKLDYEVPKLIQLYQRYINKGWKQILLKPVFYNIRNQSLGKKILLTFVENMKNKEDLKDLRLLIYQEANSSSAFIQRIIGSIFSLLGINKAPPKL